MVFNLKWLCFIILLIMIKAQTNEKMDFVKFFELFFIIILYKDENFKMQKDSINNEDQRLSIQNLLCIILKILLN